MSKLVSGIAMEKAVERKLFAMPEIRKSMKEGACGLRDHKNTKASAVWVFKECFTEFANKQIGDETHDIMKDILNIILPLGDDLSKWPKGTYESIFAKIAGPMKTMMACWYLSGVMAWACGWIEHSNKTEVKS